MPYSRITKTSHGRDAIKYALEGKGHDGSEGRNVEVGVVNLNPYGDYADQMKTYWDKAIARHKTQILRIIISFAKEELDPSDENDRLKAQFIGQDFVKKYYPGRQAVVCVQIDGKSGLVHIHILINDVHMETYKGHTDEQGHYASVEKWADEVSAEYIENLRNPRKENEKTPDKITRTERAKRDAGKYVWKDSLKARIRGAMEACVDEKSFMNELERRGVTGVKRESKKYGTYYTYTLDKKYIPRGEKMPKNLSARSYNLGDDYGYEAMQRHIRKNVKVIANKHENASDQRKYPEEEKLTMTPEEQAALIWKDEDDGIAPGDWRSKAKKWRDRAEAVWKNGQDNRDDEVSPESETESVTEVAEPVTEDTQSDVLESEAGTPQEEIPTVDHDDNKEVSEVVREAPAALSTEETELQEELVQVSPVIEKNNLQEEPVPATPEKERTAERRPARSPAPAGPVSLDDVIAAQVRAKEREQKRQDMQQKLHDQQTKQVADLRKKGGKVPENYADLLWNSMNRRKDAGGEEYE